MPVIALALLISFIVKLGKELYLRKRWEKLCESYRHAIPESLPLEKLLNPYEKTYEIYYKYTYSEEGREIRDKYKNSEFPIWVQMMRHAENLITIAGKTIGIHRDAFESPEKTSRFPKEGLQEVKELATEILLRFIKTTNLQKLIKSYGDDSTGEVDPELKEKRNFYVEKHKHWLDTMEGGVQELNSLRLQLESSSIHQDISDLEQAIRNARSAKEALQEIIDLDDPVAAFDRKLAEA